jgi:hypothetical protein
VDRAYWLDGQLFFLCSLFIIRYTPHQLDNSDHHVDHHDTKQLKASSPSSPLRRPLLLSSSSSPSVSSGEAASTPLPSSVSQRGTIPRAAIPVGGPMRYGFDRYRYDVSSP